MFTTAAPGVPPPLIQLGAQYNVLLKLSRSCQKSILRNRFINAGSFNFLDGPVVLLHITFCPSESLVQRQIWLRIPHEHFARDLIQADPKHNFCQKRFNTRSFNFLDGFSWGVEAEKPAVAIPVFPALPISGTV